MDQTCPCKTKTSQPKEVCKSSLKPRRIQKSFTLTIPWNLAKLVKISLGIIAPTRLRNNLIDFIASHIEPLRHSHHTDRRLTVMPRAVRRIKEGTSVFLLQSGPNASWWAHGPPLHVCQAPNAFVHQMRFHVCHQMRLCVCVTRCVYMCVTNSQRSSLRSHVFFNNTDSDPEWTQNDPKWTENGPKMDPKWTHTVTHI